MAIGGRTNIEQTKDNKLRYLEEDNVVNVTKNDLTSLQASLKVDQEQDLDAKLTVINDHVERYFNGFLTDERDNNVTLTVNGANITDTVKSIVMSGNKAKLNALGNYVIDKSKYEAYVDEIKDEEIKTVLKKYDFELNDLRKEIEDSGVQPTTSRDEEGGNVLLDDLDEGTSTETTETTETIEQYDGTKDYIDPYKNTGYANPSEKLPIENIYRDNDIRKSLERIFDKETEKELHKGTFRINLSVEDGLAGVIIAIREAMIAGASGETAEEGNETDAQKLYTYLSDNNLLPDDEETGSLKIERKQIKELIELGLIPYKGEGILNFEKIKLAKILSNAKRTDLDEFASLLQSKPDIAMAVKEWNNALEMTGNSRADKYDKIEQTSLVNSANVLQFLCDYNSDGQISAAYYKKDKKETKRREAQKGNKEQENQGDVGTLFGQQIFFTIEQAIKVKNIELGDPQGEQLVISNIIKNMQIADSRNLTGNQRIMLDSMSDAQYCTRENLTKLINGDEDESISPMPTFKVYFLDAIKKINGGSQEVNPDLYDTLVGKEAENLIALHENEANLKSKLDEILAASTDPTIIELIKKNGLVRVRETLLTKVMAVLDNVELTFNDGTHVPIGDKTTTGISKSWEIRQTKNELIEKTWKNLVQGGIAVSPTGAISLSLGFGKTGISESGNRKRSRSVGSGVTLGTDGVLVDILNISGDIEFQYNKNKVISADLSKIKSAKYLGLEGSAGLGLGIGEGETVLGVRGSAGINRSRDPEIGINQIDKQYRAISEEIFDVSGAPLSTLSDKTAFRAYLKNKIDTAKSDGTYGDFVTNNEQHLTDNMDFIVRYMAANKFFGENGIFKKYPQATTANSVNALLDIIQSGNIELRRHDVIAGLHGVVKLTKLSFGLTTSMFTLKTWKKETPPPPVLDATTNTGGYTEPPKEITDVTTVDASIMEDLNNNDNGDNVLPTTEVVNTGPARNASYNEVKPDENVDTGENVIDNTTVGGDTDKYGALFMYVGARVSTWRNMYAPNVPQYLFTQYETGQGVGTEYIDNPTKDLDKYGKYLIALYNDPKNRLSYSVDAGRLVLNFTPEKGSDLTLARFLNIHATTKAQEGFSLKGNTLIMGNVGDIGAYTITEAKGVRRILSLGTKKVDEATRITANNATTTVEAMKPVEESNKEWTQEKIQTDIIPNMTGEGTNVETAKTDTALFFDSEGKLTKPAQKTVNFNPTSIEGTKVTTGTLTIKKVTDENFIVILDGSSPKDKLTITYIDEKEYQASFKEEIKNDENFKPVESFTVDKLFSFEGELLKVQTLLDTLSGDIKDFERNNNNTNKTEYFQFLSSASNLVDNDGYINDIEINKAIEYLKVLLPNSTTSLVELREYLNSTDRSTKTYIVDRLKQIFAKDAWYTGKQLSYILEQHTGWETVTGPSNTKLPDALLKEIKTQRNTVWKKTTQTYSESPTVNPNLIGYTAFYRYAGTQYKNVKFSMTSLGNTSSQVDLYNITDNKEQAKERFLGNLEKNQYEVENLATALEKQFKAQGITQKIKRDNYDDTKANIKKLLNGESIPLDFGGKISIDFNWVFYLLGQCCNESIGVEITKIKIQELQDNITIKGKYSASGTPDKEYKGGMDLYTKSHSITSRVVAQEEKVGVKAISKQINKKDNSVDGSTDTGAYV